MIIRAPGFLKPSLATAPLFAALVLLSNPAFSCQGENYRKTEWIIKETVRVSDNVLVTGNYDQAFRWMATATRAARQLPESCQSLIRQAMAPYQPEGPSPFDKLPW